MIYELQWTNEHTSYTSHTLFSKGLWEVSWRRGQTATYWPKVLLTIAALLSHSGWAAQPCITEGPIPLSGAGSHSVVILSPTATGTDWLQLELTQAVCGTWLYNCLISTCFLRAYASALNSTTSTGQGDIPISSAGYTCFAVPPFIYTGASLDWRLGRWSICYIYIYIYIYIYMIYKHILLIMLLNEAKFILLHTFKWFQELLSITTRHLNTCLHTVKWSNSPISNNSI